jgi:hypothetical protein
MVLVSPVTRPAFEQKDKALSKDCSTVIINGSTFDALLSP